MIERSSRAECSCIREPWCGREPQWPKRCCGRPRGRRCSHVARARQRGAVLAIVLLLSAMLLVTSAAWFEASLAAARSAVNVRDYLQAFHAADSALTLCARGVIGSAGVGVIASQAAREPAQWKLETVFEAAQCAMAGGRSRAAMCGGRVARRRPPRCARVSAHRARIRQEPGIASVAADAVGSRRQRSGTPLAAGRCEALLTRC